MDIWVIYEDIKEHGLELTVLIALILKCIEISPLKLNPWTKIKNWFSRLITGDVVAKIDEVNKSLKQQKTEIDEIKKDLNDERAKTARYRIIRFDDEMTHGVEHSEDHKEQIMDDIATYEVFCTERPYIKNHKGQAAMKRITDRYVNKLPM